MTDQRSVESGSFDEFETEPKRSERSLGELFGEMSGELSTLFRQEIELAKVEAREQGTRAAKVAAMAGAAGLGAWMALLFISLAVAWLLDQALNRALAFGIVAAVWLIAAAVLASRARQTAKEIRPLPETTRSLKEDVEWAKAQKS